MRLWSSLEVVLLSNFVAEKSRVSEKLTAKSGDGFSTVRIDLRISSSFVIGQ